MLSVGLVAVDATILATAVPSIVDDLGGFSQFPWLFSIYLLAQAVTVPLYGKFSDVLGRKPIMLFGIALFLIGSVLCGLAWNMVSLIIFRAIQGFGAGAIFPMSMTIVGDLYTVAERSKVQGYVGSVWAMASVIGPALGGVFSEYLSWRWIFFVNVPIGLVAAAMLVRRFREDVTRTHHTIDFTGAVLLASGGALLILGLLEGGVEWAWGSPTGIAVIAGAVLLLVSFVLVEQRAVEPILPLWIFRRRLLNGTNAASLVVGVVMIGLTSYVPLFAQGVLGTDALVAGFAVAALTVGWPISAAIAGRFYLRIGFRPTAFMGSAFAVSGAALLLFVSEDSSILHLAASCFVIGIGLGFIAAPLVVAAQSSVEWAKRGVVTGTTMFARSVGSAVGIAIFGAIANAAVTRRLGSGHQDLDDLPSSVLEPSIHEVYIGIGVAALVLVGAIALLPRHISTNDSP